MPGGPFTLIIEDDAPSRELLQDALRRDGHVVAVAATGAEAIKVLESTEARPSAVLLDLVLPTQDGWAFHSWLRRQTRYADVPVVVLTDMDPHLERFSGAPPTVLRKPIQLAEVRQALTAKPIEAPAAAAPRAPQENTGPRVLVIDDDADLRELTRDVLEEDGLAVSVARDGREAMELLTRESISLVLLDLKMPNVDGWDVFVWIRGQQRLKDLPVVILSGSSAPRRTQEMLNRDLPFWVKKPVRPNELLKLVRQHLALRTRGQS